jgi:hypothetical protein
MLLKEMGEKKGEEKWGKRDIIYVGEVSERGSGET